MSEAIVSVFSDHICRLGEGPSYDPATDSLYWFDIVNSQLLEKRLSGGETRVHALGQMARAIAIIVARRQLIATETGLHVRDVATGKMTLHTPIEADNPMTRSNDSRVHPCGALWTGTMGKGEEKGAGSIYWFFKGELRKLYSGITVSNSICFSENGTIAYYTDTATGLLMRVACDPAGKLIDHATATCVDVGIPRSGPTSCSAPTCVTRRTRLSAASMTS